MTNRMALLLLIVPAAALAQERLPLEDAVARARSRHPSAQAAGIAEREAAAKADDARAALLPRVDLVESWQRGNLPVFAFSSLLSQRRFRERDFDVTRLNDPDAIDHFRTAVSLDQVLFDGAMRPAIRSAELGRERAALSRREVEQALAMAAVEGYGRVLLLEALAQAARAAVAAADRDARRARDRHEVGIATLADVLSLEVHTAAMREREIQTIAEARVARARLNDLIGAPLDAAFVLDPIPPPAPPPAPLAALEAQALDARPDVLKAAVDRRVADAGVSGARAAFLPQVALRGLWEWNGGAFATRDSGWLVGAEMRFNLFRGLGDRARLTQARAAVERYDADRTRVENAARLEVRAAAARLEAAAARIGVAQSIVAQARESARIVRDRYENGLADVTALLQVARAELDAAAQDVAARVEQLVQRAALDRAIGR
jgi:outer membrane protein